MLDDVIEISTHSVKDKVDTIKRHIARPGEVGRRTDARLVEPLRTIVTVQNGDVVT